MADYHDFETWRDARILVQDISEHVEAYADSFCGDETQAGYIYPGHLVIEKSTETMWYLILYNDDWLQEDLEGLEKMLHQFALDEGILDYLEIT